MDDPNVDRFELAGSLRCIRLVNRRLGGAQAALRQLKRWGLPKGEGELIRILDLGTGSADIPIAIADWAKPAGHRVHITAIDLHATTLGLAREHVGSRGDIELVQADALQLMDRYEPGSFHYAHAGMFLHHLSDVEVMTVLRIMDRLTTRGVIWNDLCRNWVGWIGSRVLTARLPEMIHHDAIVSVAAGFTRREAIELAQRAGLPRIKYRRHLMYRFTLVSEKA